MTEPIILTIVAGVLTTLLGVGFGCLVLELTVRAMANSLKEPQAKTARVQYALGRRRLSIH